jgi:hypothetical protein
MAKRSPHTDQPTPAEFVAALANRGVTLKTDGTRIWATAKGALTSEEYGYAHEHNAQLVALLKTEEKPNAAGTAS